MIATTALSLIANNKKTKLQTIGIKYRDGDSIERLSNAMLYDKAEITHKDPEGNVLETTNVDYKNHATYNIKADGSRSDYKADGSYLTTWPKKPDGSQQFYDSKQQKLFVRDANGNIIR